MTVVRPPAILFPPAPELTNEIEMPSEAEWEYACRADNSEDVVVDFNANTWYINNSGEQNNPIGRNLPNAGHSMTCMAMPGTGYRLHCRATHQTDRSEYPRKSDRAGRFLTHGCRWLPCCRSGKQVSYEQHAADGQAFPIDRLSMNLL